MLRRLLDGARLQGVLHFDGAQPSGGAVAAALEHSVLMHKVRDLQLNLAPLELHRCKLSH